MGRDRFGEGLALHRSGRLEDAVRLYQRVLAFEPQHAGALHMLGVVRLAQGRFEEAAGLLARSLAAEPGFAVGHYNHGCALQALGRPEDAALAYRRAIALDGRHAGARLNLSGVLLLLRRPQEAFEAARCAAEIEPGLAAAHCNAGLALKAAGLSERAEAMFRTALDCDPAHAESLHNLGNLVRQVPGREAEARGLLTALIRAKPRMIEPRIALAQSLKDGCEGLAAAAALEAAATLSPDEPLVRLALAMSPLQALYRTEAEREDARAAYAMRLGELDGWTRAGGRARLASLADAAGMVQPFYLPYAGEVDRDLQAVHGSLMADAATARYGAAELPGAPPAGERIRVGFVSGYMRDHSNWKVPLGGWMRGLDRERFELFGYYTGEITHPETEEAASLCARFLQGPRTTAEWRSEILGDRPHVLIHPETGMDGAAFRLAAMRLAPLQCVSWGHPVTSGLPTMDLFLSSELMEPTGAEAHYTERLVRLPGLGIDYRAPSPAPEAAMRARFGLPECTLFFCGQALFKYLPLHDRVLARIAGAVPDARFVFIDAPQGRQVRTLLRTRLATSLDVARCMFLDRLGRDDFVALSGVCDVVLDSLDWSGCNSTLECLPLGTPIVTLPGRTMRARHTAAILTMIGVTDGIARDEEDYVRLAVGLAGDGARRDAIRARLVGSWRSAAGDMRPVRALEALIEREVRGASS